MTNNRGWRLERQVRTVDTVGRPVDVTVGLVRDQYGRLCRGLAVGNSPSALFTIPDMTALIRAIEQSTEDLLRLQGGQEP